MKKPQKKIRIASIGLLALNFLLPGVQLNAQNVGINTSGSNPEASAMLDVSSTSKGMLFPRMTTTQRDAISSPANSLFIFNVTTRCFEAYDSPSSTWVAFGCIGCTVPSGVSASATPNPICEGSALTLMGTATNATSWAWTGPNSFSSTLQNPTITSITASGAGVYTLTASNACAAASPVNTTSVVVSSQPTVSNAGVDQNVCASTATLAGNTPTVGTGTWTLISGTGTITSPNSPTSGITGLGNGANTFRWTITNSTCTPSADDVVITNSIPTTANAGTDQTLACGLTTTSLTGNTPTIGTGSWTVITGTATITDPSSPTSGVTGLAPNGYVTLRWTITNAPCSPSTDDVNIKTIGSCCIATTSTVLTPVTNPSTGKTWMDRNLGASQVATAIDDDASFGCTYQWGRAADGHENRGSVTTTNIANTATPNLGNSWDGLFIINPIWPNDWLNPPNVGLWQGLAGVNNPCPASYRVPAFSELDEERLSWATNDASGAFGSPLKLSRAGGRNTDGSFNLDSNGLYWSSTIHNATTTKILIFNTGAGFSPYNRGTGLSIRCIKD